MSDRNGVKKRRTNMITPVRLSYGVLAATIILLGLLHLGVPLLAVLFSYFAVRQLYLLTKRKWLALVLFGVVVAGIATAAVFLTRAAILALPDVADTSLPSASAWAEKRQIDLPFNDFESFKKAVVNALFQNRTRPSPRYASGEEQSVLHLLRRSFNAVPRFLPQFCHGHWRADHDLGGQHDIDGDFPVGSGYAECPAAHRGDASLRPCAYRR